MKTWERWLTAAAAAASLMSAPALAQYNTYPVGAPPPGQGTYAPQPPPQPMPQPRYQHDELDFRGTLSPYGEWLFVPGVGEVWRPYDHVVGPGFRPYVTAGHWVYTEYGWSWESDYPWGWAPFHYGRWVYRARWGWVWRPGRVWAPAWVEWRSGAGYVGWSPMPPEGVEVYEPSMRHSWCFVETTNFVSFRLPNVILAPERVRLTFGSTTPINTRRGHDGTSYWWVGPPPAHIATAVGRPVKPIDLNTYSPPGGHWRGHAPRRPVAPPAGTWAGPPPGQGTGSGSGSGLWEGFPQQQDRNRGWGRDRDRDDDRQGRRDRDDGDSDHRGSVPPLRAPGNRVNEWREHQQERRAEAQERREERREEREERKEERKDDHSRGGGRGHRER